MKQKIFKVIIIMVVLCILCILCFYFLPNKEITYYDDTGNSGISIDINKNVILDFGYLYEDQTPFIESWSNVLLNSITIRRNDTEQLIIIKKCTINLYDDKKNSIPFKRIDWHISGIISDEEMLHFKSESAFLKEYKKVVGDTIYYVFDVLDDSYKKIRLDYHFILIINGKTHEIKGSKELHRKVKWVHYPLTTV